MYQECITLNLGQTTMLLGAVYTKWSSIAEPTTIIYCPNSQYLHVQEGARGLHQSEQMVVAVDLSGLDFPLYE